MALRKISTVVLLLLLSKVAIGQENLRKISGELLFNNPPFQQCHASTIVETEPGKFLVAAFGGTGEGNRDVCIWLTSYSEGKWGEPVKAADGIIIDSLRYPCWNPVLFRQKQGKLFLFYKVGPSPAKWWGMVKHSDDNGKSWDKPSRLPDGIIGPVKNKPVELNDGSILAGSSTETGGNWKIHMELSSDSGMGWKIIPCDPSTKFQVIQPAILVHNENKLQILCRSKSNVILSAFSYDKGKTWSELKATSLPNPDSGIDAVTLSDGKHLLVYNPLRKGGEDRARLSVAISSDGESWKEINVLEDERKGEYSYPAVIQSADGKIHITYTYNRVNIKHVVLEE